MKDLIVLLLLALLVFLVWNGRQTAAYAPDAAPQVGDVMPADAKPVPPEVTQRILDQIRTGEIPIDTLFIKDLGEGNYSARFLFFNPNGYTGAQYDVTAKVTDGAAEITAKTQVGGPDEWNPAYRGQDSTPWSALTS
jgi:hypothetical protein